jgi:hypothetical protein
MNHIIIMIYKNEVIFLNNPGGWPRFKTTIISSDPYVRLFHAAPGTPAVDVYANGNMVAQGLTYGQITVYVPVNPGSYNIQVFQTCRTSNPLICSSISIAPETSQTIAGVGEPGRLSLFPIKEVYMPIIDKRSSYVRFVNLSPDSPALDVYLPDGTKILTDIAFMDYSKYITVPPGSYTVVLKPLGGDNVLYTIQNLTLMPGTISSVFALGFVDGEPPLETVMYPDGMY